MARSEIPHENSGDISATSKGSPAGSVSRDIRANRVSGINVTFGMRLRVTVRLRRLRRLGLSVRDRGRIRGRFVSRVQVQEWVPIRRGVGVAMEGIQANSYT